MIIFALLKILWYKDNIFFNVTQCYNSVTTIGDWAFSGCSGLTSVTIPNSVTTICYHAFYNCTGLTSVTIPNSVTTIGSGAFFECESLTEVNITDLSAWCKIDFGNYFSNPLYYAKKLKLNGTEIKDLVIPNDITEIKNSAFSGCSGLTSVTIPSFVTTIGEDAFYKCSGLTEVNITDLSAWCKMDFSRPFSDPLYYAKKLKLNGTEIKELIIPNDIIELKDWAFANCRGLTSVIIPNSVTKIGDWAFYKCDGLTSVTIPNSVTSIGSSTFRECTGLTLIEVAGGNSVYDSRDNCNAIIKTATNTLILGCKNTIIPNSVTTIGNSAFEDCSGLTSVTIPNSVTEIGDKAFRDCDNLDSVIITNPNTRYNDNYNSDYYTFDEHTKIIYLKQEEKSERDSYRWQYVSYGDDKCGAKSTDGKEIVPTEYSEVEYVPNYEGYFLVRKNGCYAIYNPSGKIIIPISRGYSSIIKTRSDGRIYYRVSKGGKYGVCGVDGYEIVAPLYDNIICIDGVFLYKDINGTWIPLNKGLDKNNAVVENPTYTKRDVAYYDLALQQGRLEDSFGKKVRVEQTSTEGTRAFKIVFEDKILFEFGEYDLSSSALDYIDKVAETLKELPSTRVRITGYTDNVGSLASNRLLSTQRANAVSEYLQQKGISASRIIAKGVPLADYVATNKTEEGRALNRRVEIIIEATGHRAK
ncbi:MAG: leucine-rich repeat protein [Muribaculaceae bacterium]|nr:leucine-rich repeat protein [Muribaculaceae bacterium]